MLLLLLLGGIYCQCQRIANLRDPAVQAARAAKEAQRIARQQRSYARSLRREAFYARCEVLLRRYWYIIYPLAALIIVMIGLWYNPPSQVGDENRAASFTSAEMKSIHHDVNSYLRQQGLPDRFPGE